MSLHNSEDQRTHLAYGPKTSGPPNHRSNPPWSADVRTPLVTVQGAPAKADIGREDSDHEGKSCKVEDLGWVHIDFQHEIVVDAETKEPVHGCFEDEESDGLPAREGSDDRVVEGIGAFRCASHTEDTFITG